MLEFQIKAIILPLNEYASVVWNPTLEKKIY